MRLRRALTQDMEAITDIFFASRRQAMPWLPEQHDRAATVAFFRDVVAPRRQVHVACDDTGVVLGFIAFGDEELEHLYVNPDVHSKGVGSALLAVAKEHERVLKLWVFQRNQRARTFYERHGFELVRLTDGGGNAEREPDARYRWARPG
jgi:GNAT superfamily N-acetyltransferase